MSNGHFTLKKIITAFLLSYDPVIYHIGFLWLSLAKK